MSQEANQSLQSTWLSVTPFASAKAAPLNHATELNMGDVCTFTFPLTVLKQTSLSKHVWVNKINECIQKLRPIVNEVN